MVPSLAVADSVAAYCEEEGEEDQSMRVLKDEEVMNEDVDK